MTGPLIIQSCASIFPAFSCASWWRCNSPDTPHFNRFESTFLQMRLTNKSTLFVGKETLSEVLYKKINLFYNTRSCRVISFFLLFFVSRFLFHCLGMLPLYGVCLSVLLLSPSRTSFSSTSFSVSPSLSLSPFIAQPNLIVRILQCSPAVTSHTLTRGSDQTSAAQH